MDRSISRTAEFVVGLLLVALLLDVLSHELRGQERTEGAPLPVILEVVNYHFTIGRKIPSVFLKVLSDGTVECQSLKGAGTEGNVVRTKALTPDEFQKVKKVIDQSKLLDAKEKYELTHPVIDSWMEWHIKIPRTDGEQDIAIAAFASSPLREGSYPIAVVRLGCTISKLREEAYGDEPDYRRGECKRFQ
jgi:hypothetical protein